MRSDNLYSRFVVWAKLILPLIALALLSSLFLISEDIDLADGIDLSETDLAEIAERERINNPRYAGTTNDGLSISLSADEAFPDQQLEKSYVATAINAHVEMPDGALIDIVAARGSINGATASGSLTGGAVLETSIDYNIVTEGLTFESDVFRVQSLGKIAAATPSGDLTAGEMEITLETTDDAGEKPGYLLVFKKGVKLIYSPKNESP